MHSSISEYTITTQLRCTAYWNLIIHAVYNCFQHHFTLPTQLLCFTCTRQFLNTLLLPNLAQPIWNLIIHAVYNCFPAPFYTPNSIALLYMHSSIHSRLHALLILSPTAYKNPLMCQFTLTHTIYLETDGIQKSTRHFDRQSIIFPKWNCQPTYSGSHHKLNFSVYSHKLCSARLSM
jgi:hypothetical protein